jgi:hypothetical protein
MSYIRQNATHCEGDRKVKRHNLDYGSLLVLLRQSRAIGPFELAFNSTDIQSTLHAQGEFTIDQELFHPKYGLVTIVGIEGSDLIVREEIDVAVIHQFKSTDILSEHQARSGLMASSFAGGHKAYRYRQAKWAWLQKLFCKKRGDWKTVLEQCNLHRSSMDDLVRWYDDEIRFKAQELETNAMLPDSGNISTPEVISGGVLPITAPRVNERTPDPTNTNRQENIKVETAKRTGIKPTHHKTTLYLQRRHLDPNRLDLYHEIEKANKALVISIMQRNIDHGIDEVLASASSVLQQQPGAIRGTTKTGPATMASELSPPSITHEDDSIVTDVRSGLRGAGIKQTEIKRIHFISGLDFDAQYRQALKQLKSNGDAGRQEQESAHELPSCDS